MRAWCQAETLEGDLGSCRQGVLVTKSHPSLCQGLGTQYLSLRQLLFKAVS